MYRPFQSEELSATIHQAGHAISYPALGFDRAERRPARQRDGLAAYRASAPAGWPFDEPGHISPDLLTGMWSMRFGMFGCRDSETRGAAAYVEKDRLFGGDNYFAYHGEWSMRGTELQASLNIVRHDHGTGIVTLFGTNEHHYLADCTAEAISADHIEGRIRRPGFPDARLTMRRLA